MAEDRTALEQSMNVEPGSCLKNAPDLTAHVDQVCLVGQRVRGRLRRRRPLRLLLLRRLVLLLLLLVQLLQLLVLLHDDPLLQLLLVLLLLLHVGLLEASREVCAPRIVLLGHDALRRLLRERLVVLKRPLLLLLLLEALRLQAAGELPRKATTTTKPSGAGTQIAAVRHAGVGVADGPGPETRRLVVTMVVVVRGHGVGRQALHRQGQLVGGDVHHRRRARGLRQPLRLLRRHHPRAARRDAAAGVLPQPLRRGQLQVPRRRSPSLRVCHLLAGDFPGSQLMLYLHSR